VSRVGDAGPPVLEPRLEHGWRRGFANLLRKELQQWTGTRLGWVQVALWVVLLNGTLLLPLVFMRDLFATEAAGPLESGFDMFFSLAALATPVGAIILAHGAIIGERQLGTAAWVLSKPVSRTAFVLSKWCAHALGGVATSILVPAAVAYVALSIEHGAALQLGRFGAATLLLVLNLIFYVALTLMLGTLLRARGAVLAVSLIVLVGGDALIGMWPLAAESGPWLLGRLGLLVAQGHPLVTAWPLLSTPAWAAAFMAVAIQSFRREDF
jgi:ABC-2 type transport system permease protein